MGVLCTGLQALTLISQVGLESTPLDLSIDGGVFVDLI